MDGTTTATTTAPTADDLREILAAMIGTTPAEITGDANLVLLGLGSLEMMRLATRWRRQGLVVEFRDLAARPTVDAWTELLAAARTRRQAEAGR
ncbi:phosphopantetheine-binding protein [Embleya sp. NBC_00896]|uniref:phosphopantetheine-binding protein n=1 Tax=Embleya sp. NBC_00896 TaxID=2975961 RepID=UPI00386F56D0|nr:phosphopantetheine-binding protein [Embleya sp. NBC_00896]